MFLTALYLWCRRNTLKNVQKKRICRCLSRWLKYPTLSTTEEFKQRASHHNKIESSKNERFLRRCFSTTHRLGNQDFLGAVLYFHALVGPPDAGGPSFMGEPDVFDPEASSAFTSNFFWLPAFANIPISKIINTPIIHMNQSFEKYLAKVARSATVTIPNPIAILRLLHTSCQPKAFWLLR